MNKTSRIVLALVLSLAALTVVTALASSELDSGAGTGLSWNLRKDEPPFIQQAGLRADFTGPLVFPGREFALPLAQVLAFDPQCDCYSLMVKKPSGDLVLVNLWRTQTGFYRSGNGPYLELTNLDSSKSVTTLDGTRLLFAQVGDGEWRCVSVRDSLGNYLLIDYRPDGLIARIHDSQDRNALPEYNQGQMSSLRQSWTAAGSKQEKLTGF